METEVKGHYVHRDGERVWIPEHEMHVNKKEHKRHEHRLKEEAEAIEHMMHEHTEHLKEDRKHRREHKKKVML